MLLFWFPSIYRLVPPLGTTYHGGGWGGMLTFMWTCRSSWLGEVLKAVRDLQLLWRDKNQNWSHMFLGKVFKHRVHVHTNADDDDVMMMMMTLMKLVNSGTKFRPGIDKFYEPNSGCAQFQEVGRGYIYIHYYVLYYYYYCYLYYYVLLLLYVVSYMYSMYHVSILACFMRNIPQFLDLPRKHHWQICDHGKVLANWSQRLIPAYIYIGFIKVDIWLVVWNMFFFHILGRIIPTDFHIFQRGWNHQPHMYISDMKA